MNQQNQQTSVQAYQNLSLSHKHILGLLAIHATGFPAKAFSHCWNLFIQKHEDILSEATDPEDSSASARLQKQIPSLIRKNLIVRENTGLFCQEDIRFQAVADMVRRGCFADMASIALQISSFSQIREQISQGSKNAYIRCMQMAIFLDMFPSMITILKSEWENAQLKHLNSGTEPLHFFTSMFDSPFQGDVLESLPIPLQGMILNLVMEEISVYKTPGKEFLAHIHKFFSSRPSLTSYKTRAMDLFCQQGMFDQYQDILATLETENTPAWQLYRGCLVFLQGNTQTALKHFQAGISLLQDRRDEKDKFWGELPLLMFLFAVIKNNDRIRHSHIIDLIESQDREETETPLLLSLFYALYQTNGLFSLDEEVLEYCAASYGSHPLYWLFNLIFMNWQDKALATNFADTLEDFFHRVSHCGYAWIAAEAAMLLDSLSSNDRAIPDHGKTAHKKMGTTSLLETYRPIQDWEKQLQALTDLAKGEELFFPEIFPPSSQRIVWILKWDQIPENQEQYLELPRIFPKLQKKTKKGTWTKGRSIALKNLYQNQADIPCITRQDQKVCAAIHEYSRQSRSGYGYYRYGYFQKEYSLDPEQAIMALIGHDLVFMEGADELLPVSLAAGEPEIRLTRTQEKIMVSAIPGKIPQDANILLTRESLSRLTVIRLTEEHFRLFTILGKNGLQAPENTKEHIQKALLSLSSLVRISSDLALNPGSDRDGENDKDTENIMTDPCPHVLITPSGDGIFLEFRVRPFQDKGPYYRPGKGGAHIIIQHQKKPLSGTRNLEEERYLVKKILESCPEIAALPQSQDQEQDQWQIADPETALAILFELKDCPENMILSWAREKTFSLRSSVCFEKLTLGIEKHRDWFKATGSLAIDQELTLDLKELLSMMDKAQGRFIPLDDGSFLGLTRQLKKRLEELKRSLYSDRNDLLFSPLAHGTMKEIAENAGQIHTDRAWKAHCKALRETVSPKVPSPLHKILRPYQKQGFQWLAQLMHWQTGACLADDMGLGKTIQALSALLLCAEKGPSLVVAPVSVMANWEEECRKFAPGLSPKLFHSTNRKEIIKHLGPLDLVITSYGLLQTEQKTLESIQWQAIVLDEAQAIKNMNTKRSKAAMALKGKFRLITTGTPLENHLSELWTLFRFINPGLLGSYQRFRKNFAIPIERDHNQDAARCLKKLIRPFVLRRLKSDVLTELPEKTEITIHVEMSREEAALYEAQRLRSIEKIQHLQDNNPQNQQRIEILAELTRLRQLCCHPDLIAPEAKIDSSKQKIFADIIEELLANRHKVLVFSQFVRHLNLLKNFLDQRDISYQYLSGSTTAKERKKRIDAFQQGQGDLFLISLKAGGTGLNLTAADYVIHMDPWWNPAVEDQASDRAHRIGQTKPVTVYRLVLKGTIEDQILRLHKEKRNLAQDLLAGTDAAGKISTHELLELLKQPFSMPSTENKNS